MSSNKEGYVFALLRNTSFYFIFALLAYLLLMSFLWAFGFFFYETAKDMDTSFNYGMINNHFISAYSNMGLLFCPWIASLAVFYKKPALAFAPTLISTILILLCVSLAFIGGSLIKWGIATLSVVLSNFIFWRISVKFDNQIEAHKQWKKRKLLLALILSIIFLIAIPFAHLESQIITTDDMMSSILNDE